MPTGEIGAGASSDPLSYLIVVPFAHRIEGDEVRVMEDRWFDEQLSGCRAEQARLRTAERLVRLLAVFCILSWRVFWLTMLNRVKPDHEPALVLTELETSAKLWNRPADG